MLSSNYHVEMSPGDVGHNDRYVVQAIIKDMARNRPLDATGEGGEGRGRRGEGKESLRVGGKERHAALAPANRARPAAQLPSCPQKAAPRTFLPGGIPRPSAALRQPSPPRQARKVSISWCS